MLKNLEDSESCTNIGTDWVTERIIELDKIIAQKLRQESTAELKSSKSIFSDKSIALIEQKKTIKLYPLNGLNFKSLSVNSDNEIFIETLAG